MFNLSHLHPMLVHFPIALIVVGFIVDSLQYFIKKEPCFSKMGFYFLLIGTLAAVLTLLSGIFFTSDMSGEAEKVMESHELFAWTTVILLIILSALRTYATFKNVENKLLKQLIFIMYGLAAICVSITGYFGGSLVYNYMMPL